MPTSPVTSSRPRAPALRRAAVLLATVLAAGAAQAATWTVTSVGDSATTAPCSASQQCANLRDAIAVAAAGDTITFSATGAIALVATLNVSKNLTIQGPGAAQLTLSGQGAVRILNVSAGSLTLNAVTLSDGFASGSFLADTGGAVVVDRGATLSLADSVVRNNKAGMGGGLSALGGTLTVTRTTFDNNSALGILGGGAAFLNGQAGIPATGTFVANTFSGNNATNEGGAINVNSASVLTAVNNSFVGNWANIGGALIIYGRASIRSNAFSGNEARGNMGDGAAIHARLLITGMDNNVFADNASTPGAGALFGRIAGSHNAFFNNTSNGAPDDATGYGTTSPVIATAAPLGALGNHGGLTQTMLPQGAALCAGDASLLPAGTTTDQRGLPRTSALPAGTCLDVGAVQLAHAAATVAVTVTGNGSVSAGATPAPLAGAINACTSQGGPACQADYDSALAPIVTLTATPPAGGSVTWGGACAGATGNSCTVTVDQARAVSAAFAAAPPVPAGLSVTVTGTGSVSAGATPAPLAGGINACTSQGGAACQADYDSALAAGVVLTATPPAGGSVTWGGACAGATGNSCTVTVDQARAVTAAFAAAPAVLAGLSVTVTGTGSVSAGATPVPLAGGINACTSQGGAACQADYDSALTASVVLTATPPAGGSVAWGGACAGTTGNSCTVTMGQARAVSAALAAAPPVPVPTLGHWALALLGALAAAIGGLALRRRGA